MSDAPPTEPSPGTPANNAKATVRWLRTRGLATLLDDTPHTRSVADAALGVLVVLFCIVMLVQIPFMGWKLWACAPIAIAAIAGARGWRAYRSRRGDRPSSRQTGWIEYGLFVLVPPLAVLTVPMGSHYASVQLDSGWDYLRSETALFFVVQQLVVLVAVLTLVRWDIVSLARWLVREMTESIGNAGTALSRVVPLLMIALFLSFFTTELWQTIAQMGNLPFFTVLGLFVALGLLFLTRREHFDVDSAAHFATQEDLAKALSGTPQEGRAHTVDCPATCPLSNRQERGLRVAASTSRLILAALIGLGVLGFLLIMGWLTVDAATVKTWAGSPAHRIVSFRGAGHTYVLSWEHVRVSAFLATFAAFYYAVASATDAAMRQGLRDSASINVRAGLAVRLALLAAAQREAPGEAEASEAPRQ